MFCAFWLHNAVFATAACNFSTSELQKVVQTCGVLYIFTSKCAFRHSGVQFFDIWTSKSGPNMRCFVHFHFQMCFSPQRRAIFRHLNFKKWSKHAVFCTFSLAHVVFATAACNFWFLLWASTSAPAALTGLLLDWPDTRIIEKTQHFATSLTFGADVSPFFWLSRYSIFFLLTWLLYSAFHCPYCRKFLFKLPSMITSHPTVPSLDSTTPSTALKQAPRWTPIVQHPSNSHPWAQLCFLTKSPWLRITNPSSLALTGSISL